MTCGSRYSALILVNSITGLNLRAVLEVYTKISAHLSFFLSTIYKSWNIVNTTWHSNTGTKWRQYLVIGWWENPSRLCDELITDKGRFLKGYHLLINTVHIYKFRTLTSLSSPYIIYIAFSSWSSRILPVIKLT